MLEHPVHPPGYATGGGCTCYCSVKLVAVIGDSGLCLFYQWVWSEGDLMLSVISVVRKDHFAIGLC